MSGISRRLIASYVLVTVAVLVLVEGFVLGYQAPRLVNDAQLEAQLRATAASYWDQLSRLYPNGLPSGVLLGETKGSLDPATAKAVSAGSIILVPAIAGTKIGHKAAPAVVAISENGTIIASSIPSRYPPGQAAGRQLPGGAVKAVKVGLLKGVSGGTGSTPYGSVDWTLYGAGGQPAAGTLTYLYVQAPQPGDFTNPITAWSRMIHVSGTGPLLGAPLYALLIAILPIGVLVGVLASRRLVSRVRRLERATVAVTGGDYSVTVPASGRDEVGRLEANLATMTGQLSSALAAERERASSEARAAERSRIAREIHDAISQHLFGLRMIASGMRRADPHNEQVRAIEHITEEALRDMEALLLELRPASLDGAGLVPALQQVCATYRDRLGLTVQADLAEITVPEPVEHALLRVTQEACTNAVRHGHAHQLDVSLTRTDGQVELSVRDDGTGFDPATSQAGAGLQHIRDRVSELGGTVNIYSAPGAGATLTVRVPTP